MNNPYFLHDAWPVNRLGKPKEWSTDYFDSVESVLSPLGSYTSVCSAMRADVLATLFLTRRFHVVYALGVTGTLQPAATKYMDRYGPLMAYVTLEVDFTRLGGSWKPEAANLDGLAGLRGVRALVERFVERQLAGRQGIALRDLRVLVRRYYGFRPASMSSSASSSHPPEKAAATPYTPDEHISYVLDPLKRLDGSRIDALTFSGTSKSYALELVASLRDSNSNPGGASHSDSDSNAHDGRAREEQNLQDKDRGDDILYRLPAREWPLLLPGSNQGCVVDCGPDRGGVKLITWDDRAGLECEVAGCRRLVTPAGDGNAIGTNEDGDGDRSSSSRAETRPRSGGDGDRDGDPRRKELRIEARGVRSIRSFSGPPVTWPRRLLGRPNREGEAARGGEAEDTQESPEGTGDEVGEGRGKKRGLAHKVLERAVSGGAKGLFGYY
jgi:hypothetical protein